MLAKMTPEKRCDQVKAFVKKVLSQHAALYDSWHVDVVVSKPVAGPQAAKLGDKFCISVSPDAFCEGTVERLDEVKRILLQNLDGVVNTAITRISRPISFTNPDGTTWVSDDPEHTPVRSAVHVWLN
jgi:hypothetical protein